MSQKPTYKELEQRVKELEEETKVSAQAIEQLKMLSSNDKTERKQEEESLRESRERFRALTEKTSDWIWEVDQRGIFTYSSPKIKDLLGYEADKVVGRTPFDLMPLDEAERVTGLFNQIAASGRPFEGLENINIHKAGRQVVLETSGVPILDEAGNLKGYRGINRDITRRKQTEEALRESEEKYRHLIENIPSVAWITDEHGNTTFISSNVEKVYGYRQQEIYEGATSVWFERIHPDDVDNVRESFQMMFAKKRKFDVEYRIQSKDGKWIWVHDTAIRAYQKNHIWYAYGVFSDITERKMAEMKYRNLFEATSDAILIGSFIDNNLIFSDCNSSTLKMLGCRREDIVGKSPVNFSPAKQPDGRSSMEKSIEIVNKAMEGRPQTFEWRHCRLDGTLFDAEISLNRVDTGKETYLQAFVRDITKRKMAEEERNRLASQLVQTQKIEALGTLAGGIAHDFNNILSAILGYSEIAMVDIQKGTQLHQNMQQVIIAGNRAKDLVKQILTFSRRAEKELKPLQLKRIVKETLKLMRASLASSIEIQTNIQSDAAVLADPSQLQQVLMNLCTNSAYAMRGEEGILKVNLTDVELDSNFLARHPDSRPGSFLKLTVSDNGCGMPPEMLERIFEPYFSTKEKSEGTGLGLAVVHGIVKSYGGTVTVQSELGKGTTFDVYLPKLISDFEEIALARKPPPTGNERILYIDDEPNLVDIGRQMLERLGYQVETRSSSIEALELFKAKPFKFDLVITDMTMPKMSGDELARQLLQIRPDIPIILCTGYSERISPKKAFEKGIRAFMMKPLALHEIAEEIRKILDDQ